MNRDERQQKAIEAWIKAKGHATIEGCTGFGKTRCAINIITKLKQKHPSIKILVVVPTQTLKEQWKSELDFRGLNVEVQIINTTAKHNYECDLLIIDEIHKAAADLLSSIFEKVTYKLILGLTATLERLDARHSIIEKYAPICDSISVREALLNGWVTRYKDYVVVIDVPDIETYKKINAEFTTYFEFFNWDFNLAMSLVGPKGITNKWRLAKEHAPNNYEKQKEFLKMINYNAAGFMRTLQARKKFIQNHPEKIRIAEEIIAHRPNKKIITFSANTKMAESFKEGYVYTGKEGKRKNRITLDEFKSMPQAIMHSCKMAIEGLDVPDLSVGIQLGVDSSKTKAIQSLGRIVRCSKDKESAEFFTIVINNTVETKWMQNAKENSDIILLDEEGLMHVLNGEPYQPYQRSIQSFLYRF